jgi:carboxymethylenebutenolidase
MFDAVADLWGGGVVASPDQLTDKRPVAPIDYTSDLRAPLLGIFGNEDQSPTPEQVNQHEGALKQQGKQYEFHRYDGAGHGFFYYDRPAYRQQQAMDAWGKVFEFFQRTLG